jgi:hypothetical protein
VGEKGKRRTSFGQVEKGFFFSLRKEAKELSYAALRHSGERIRNP